MRLVLESVVQVEKERRLTLIRKNKCNTLQDVKSLQGVFVYSDIKGKRHSHCFCLTSGISCAIFHDVLVCAVCYCSSVGRAADS